MPWRSENFGPKVVACCLGLMFKGCFRGIRTIGVQYTDRTGALRVSMEFFDRGGAFVLHLGHF